MTNEEKAIEYCGCNQPICRKGFKTKYGQNCTCARKKIYLDGLAEGEKVGFDEGYKKATERAYERQKDLTETYIKDGEKIKQLEKENAELKKQNKEILEDNDTLNKWIDELKEQIENMKCCGNCSEPCWNPPIVRKFECLGNNYSLWEMLK